MMMQPLVRLIALLVLSTVVANARVIADEADPVALAYAELVAIMQSVAADLRDSPSFGSDAEQVAGYQHALRSLMKGIEDGVLQDPDFPYFRKLDFWLKEGGDNPDQRYAFAPVRGGETYRIWGRLGSATRVELQVYAGRAWDGTGKSVGYLGFEDIRIDQDGRFEIELSSTPGKQNWINNTPETTTVFVRHIFADWDNTDPGEVHIDRVGYGGQRKPERSKEELAARIRAATEMFAASAKTWPELVNKRFVNTRQPNTLSPPKDTYAAGGAKGRWISSGHYDLRDGQMLLIRVPKTEAPYQAIQLTDMWFASTEYGNRLGSLNNTQSLLAPDNAFYYIVSADDPGYANWLDPGPFERGTLLLRWDGLQRGLEAHEAPEIRVITMDDVAGVIPGFEHVDDVYREHQLSKRRQHLQQRSNR